VRHVFARLVELESAGGRAPRLSRAALEAIAAARWPGNVRQIRSALQYALALAEDGEVRPEHLPRLEPARKRDATERRRPSPPSARSAERLDEMEHLLVSRAVEEAGGNLSLAARRLGIARSTLYRHLRRESPTEPRSQRHDLRNEGSSHG
jgi:transcriptional regulator of acetoin/glycerol metabolism